MKAYKYLLFDLDGTLTDPAEGITNSVVHALNKFGITVSDKRELNCFIGPPLLDSFRDFYGFSTEQSRLAVEYYREYYKDIGIFENLVYEGIPELLSRLRESGRTLVVATSKPEVFARRVLDHFQLTEYFCYIAGGELDGSRTIKAEVIEYALDSSGVTDRSQALMIGDRSHDVLGAKAAGIDCAGVLYGYGDRSELEAAGATYIVDTVSELKRFLTE